MKPLRQPTLIGEHHTDYSPFYEAIWARRMSRMVRGTKLQRAAFSLAASWKSSANAFMLPWLMVECLSTQHNSFTGANPPQARTIDGLTFYVGKRMADKLSGETLEELQSVMRSAALEMRMFGGQWKPPKMSPDDQWREFHGVDEFRMALSGVQRVVFPAIYFAYEDYLVSVFRIVARRHQFRKGSDEKFIELLDEHLGATVVANCWSDPDIELARLVRHAITHNGCRMTKELREFPKHGFPVLGDEIQIPPSHVKGLFHVLKGRSLNLTEIALKRLEAQNRKWVRKR